MADDNQGRGSNLTDEDRARGGQNSGGGQGGNEQTNMDVNLGSEDTESGQGQGRHGDPEGHAEAGRQGGQK
jgi:hypothetical protein